MTIVVEFIAHFRLATGVHNLSLDMDDISIREMIDYLGRKYGSKLTDELIEDGELMDDVLFLKNGELIKDNKIKLRDGDKLSLIPPAFGG